MEGPRYPTTVIERFLRYVTYDTRSEEGVKDFPSTPGQLVLLRKLKVELEDLARQTVADWPGSAVQLVVHESYRNMKEVLDWHPEALENAREAIRRAGLEVEPPPIRGGTDGSRLRFLGLPTPNLFAGQHNVHSRLEWASVWEMHKAVEVVIELAKVWEERSLP